MADYPASIYDPRTKENKSGVVFDAGQKTIIFAEDINEPTAEVVAIEETLGVNPQGSETTVSERIAALEARSGRYIPLLFSQIQTETLPTGGQDDQVHYVDISDQVPANASLLHIVINLTSTQGGDWIDFFDPEETRGENKVNLTFWSGYMSERRNIIINANEAQTYAYQCSAADAQEGTISVIGYWV